MAEALGVAAAIGEDDAGFATAKEVLVLEVSLEAVKDVVLVLD